MVFKLVHILVFQINVDVLIKQVKSILDFDEPSMNDVIVVVEDTLLIQRTLKHMNEVLNVNQSAIGISERHIQIRVEQCVDGLSSMLAHVAKRAGGDEIAGGRLNSRSAHVE